MKRPNAITITGVAMLPTPPMLHFPSPYVRPGVPPTLARRIQMPDGAQIATFVYGQLGGCAAPVLFLHGNGEEHGIFGPAIDAVVAQGLAAVAIDSRAQGKSTRGCERLSYDLLADDALRVLDALGVGRVHVVGFSDGAIEGLLLARDHADRVASLLCIGANLSPEGVVDDDFDIEGIALANEAWAAWCDECQGDVDPSLLSPTPEEARATAQLMRLMLEEPHIEAASLRAISCPTTVMVGEEDCIDDFETIAIYQAIPGARLVVVPFCGHVIPKHAPEDVNRELLDLLSRA